MQMSRPRTLEEALDRIDELEERLAAVERFTGYQAPAARPAPFPAQPTAKQAPAKPAEPLPPVPAILTGEFWTGERLLALVGGVLVLFGAVFLLTLAIGHGWLTPAMQVLLALAGGGALCGLGVYLHERDAKYGTLAQVLAGVGGGAIFLGLTAGARLYDPHVLSPSAGLVGVGLTGVILVALAVYWDAQPVAGYGIVAALLAPVLVDAPKDTLTIGFVAVALAAACAVIAWQGWPWLSQCALWPTLAQLWVYLHDGGHPHTVDGALALVWWILVAGSVLAFDLRQPNPVLRISTALTTFTTAGLSALMVGQTSGSRHALVVYLLVLAGLEAMAGAFLVLSRRDTLTTATWLWVLAAAGGGAGVSIALGGGRLTGVGIVWAVEALGLLWLSEETGDDLPLVVSAAAGVGSVLTLLATAWKPTTLAYGASDAGAFLLVGAMVAVMLAAASYLIRERKEAGVYLAGASALAVFYTASGLVVTAFSTRTAYEQASQAGQFALSLFWVAVGLAVLVVSVVRRWKPARYAGLGLLGLTAAKVLLIDTATLDAGMRVLALVIVGGVLFVGSYLLSRYERGRDE